MKMFGIKKGFSLLELILALGIGSAIALIKFQDMKVEQEDLVAKTAGEQIKQLGEAVNGYISMRYDDCLIILYFMQDKFDFHRDVIIYLMYPDFLTVFYVLHFRGT